MVLQLQLQLLFAKAMEDNFFVDVVKDGERWLWY